MNSSDYQKIRQLFDDYLRMYSSRDDRLTTYFSEDFSGFTGGGDFLVKDRAAWVAITRQDFDQVKEPIRIELKDVAIQSLTDTIAVTTGASQIPPRSSLATNCSAATPASTTSPCSSAGRGDWPGCPARRWSGSRSWRWSARTRRAASSRSAGAGPTCSRRARSPSAMPSGATSCGA